MDDRHLLRTKSKVSPVHLSGLNSSSTGPLRRGRLKEMKLLEAKVSTMSKFQLTDEASQIDHEQFQGTWITAAVEVEGVPIDSWLFEDARLSISGDRFSLRNPLPDADTRIEGVFKLDATKTPKELDLILDSGKTIEEVYELEGNTLKICCPVSGGRRPTDFSTNPNSGLSFVVYDRDRGDCLQGIVPRIK